MALYEGALEFLRNIGFLDVFLPWLLVYAITYGILIRTGIFGRVYKTGDQANVSDDEKRIAGFIASIVALSVATISIFSINFVRNIKDFIPLFVTFLIVVFTLIMIVGSFLLPNPDQLSDKWQKYLRYMGVLAVIIFIILVVNFFGLLNSIDSLLGDLSKSTRRTDWASIIVGLGILAIMGLVMYWLYKESGGSSPGSGS